MSGGSVASVSHGWPSARTGPAVTVATAQEGTAGLAGAEDFSVLAGSLEGSEEADEMGCGSVGCWPGSGGDWAKGEVAQQSSAVVTSISLRRGWAAMQVVPHMRRES